MGVEHSSGSQTLCYINADHQEECFRNEFEMHNIFEMGFDILQKDAGIMESLAYAKAHGHGGELDEEHSAALERYMSEHRTEEGHDIEALQQHLTQAGILTEPHAPVHDILRHAGLTRPVPSHHEDHQHDHHDDHHVDVHVDTKIVEETPYIHHYDHHADRHHEKEFHQHGEKHHLKELHRSLEEEEHHDDHHHGEHRHDELHEDYHYEPAHEVLAREHEHQMEHLHKVIEADFADKLMDYKKHQTGHDFRLFGHTMASYEQLSVNVKHNQCVQLNAEHQYHTERAQKWICQSHLDDFWAGECLHIQPSISICDENAIQIFLGKCVESDSWEVCPSEPIVVEHLKSEEEHEHIPEGCHKTHGGHLMCQKDLYSAFEHGTCFRVDHTFICEDDMDHITDDKCVDVGHYHVCGEDMYELFHGDAVVMHDGHELLAEFPTAHRDVHSDMCRTHEGIQFCLSDILELYQQPHDCVMFADAWICLDEVVDGWKHGCLDVHEHVICDSKMMDVALQGCVEIEGEWVCPTAVGTKHAGYNN